jgi:hypothetical protein
MTASLTLLLSQRRATGVRIQLIKWLVSTASNLTPNEPDRHAPNASCWLPLDPPRNLRTRPARGQQQINQFMRGRASRGTLADQPQSKPGQHSIGPNAQYADAVQQIILMELNVRSIRTCRPRLVCPPRRERLSLMVILP